MAFTIKYHDYWTLTLMLLGLILINSCPNKAVRWTALLVLLVVIPYKAFFHTSRMMLVSNSLTGLYLTGTLPVLLRMNKKSGLALAAIIGAVIILGLYKFADHNALRSIVAFNRMAEVIRSNDKYIEANSSYFRMVERPNVKLYNPPEISGLDTPARYVVYDGRMMTETAAKAELKQVVIKDIKDKIASFSFEGVDEKTQKNIVQDVKQEVALIVEQQAPQAPMPPI